MNNINFVTKLTIERPYGNAKQATSPQSLQRAYESDRGRIINSAAIRRLQQKTQVFPLERNAAVRSRLTHSLEVQQVGRFIVQSIFQTLSSQKQEQYGLTGLERPLETLVEMACLMHDIGNPPFGHFGEAAINNWFKTHLPALIPQHCKQPDIADFFNDLSRDIENFEGNAQAIRIVHSLLALNLTYSQTAGILKYTRPAILNKSDIPQNKNYLMKKVGYYFSETAYIDKLQTALGQETGCRHPVSYIMEAADDISYCLADIEDAVEKGILTVQELGPKLEQLYKITLKQFSITNIEHIHFMSEAVSNSLTKADRHSYNQVNQFFINLRVTLTHPLVTHAAKRFIDNIETVYSGTFNNALLEDKSHLHAITHTLKQVAKKYVFSHKEVEKLELQGFRIMTGLLDCYRPLLQLTTDEFTAIVNKTAKSLLIESRLINKLPNKHIATYQKSVKDLDQQSKKYYALEFYYRCRLIQDYISGMTDQFAYDEYRILMVID